ncbi:hypothetical protein [Aliamphritea hakodatensis]|uniref:hypothetical protein n=1 Tax=Aliamphritea hakodatensis TaxID=2895352 RepID=UPI0022FD6FAC|nr:hypothetical protein [Aliamphritea hakodatensis]
MNITHPGYSVNRPDSYQVIRGDSDDWCHLHTDSACLEQLCQISFSSPARNTSPAGLTRALELLHHKLNVLLRYSQSLEAFLQGTPVPLLPGSTASAHVILISDRYFLKLLTAATLLKKLLQLVRPSDCRLPLKLSHDIASHYTLHIRRCLTPGYEDFQQLSGVTVRH